MAQYAQMRAALEEREKVAAFDTAIAEGDIHSIRIVLTGLDRDSIEMREVSPLSGILSEGERLEVLGIAGPD